MKVAQDIEDFLSNVLTFYKDHFKRSYPSAVLFSLMAVISACILLNWTPLSGSDIKKSGFTMLVFRHSSVGGSYYLIDLYKIIYLLFISFFAVGFLRAFISGNFTWPGMVGSLKANDFFKIFLAGILAGAVDVGLYFLMQKVYSKNAAGAWAWRVIYEVRVYIPFVFYAIAVTNSFFGKAIKFKLKDLGFFWVCTWIFYVVCINLASLFEALIVSLVLIPVAFDDTRFIIEIALSIPLLAFFFIGFTSVLTFPLGFWQIEHSGYSAAEEWYGEDDDASEGEFED